MDLPLKDIFGIFDVDDSGEISKAEFFNVIDTVHKGVTIEEKELITAFVYDDVDGSIQYIEFQSLF